MKNNTIIIGISGASASGKSLLANTLLAELGSDQVVVIPEDAYYKDLSDLPMPAREKVNFDHPDSLDHPLLLQHLKALRRGEGVEIPVYDFTQHVRTNRVKKIGQHTIIVLEGILLFVEAYLRGIMDIRIFMDTPLDICLLRRLQRDVLDRGRTVKSVMEQYEETVRPMYLQFIEPSKRYADIIIPRGGENLVAMDVIKCKMQKLLKENHREKQ